MSPSLTRLLTTALLAAGAALAVLRLPRVTVEGNSMLPTVKPGDRLVVIPVKASAGRLVVATDPREPGRLLVKRAAMVSTGGVTVQGDNPGHSTDSRTFGPVPSTLVIGRPIYRYSPAETAGSLWRA